MIGSYSESNDVWTWVRKEKYNISLTIGAAVAPPIFSWAWKTLPILLFKGTEATNKDCFLHNERYFYLFQCIFILAAIYILIHNLRRTNRELVLGKEHIIRYINKNCNRKLKNSNRGKESYELVKTSVHQFYYAWIAVWMLWLAYYLGWFILYDKDPSGNASGIIFGKVFDFLSTTAMLFIYIVLTHITVNIEKRRNEDNSTYWFGFLFWLLIFILVCTLLIKDCTPELYESKGELCFWIHAQTNGFLSSLILSIFSTVTFVLVLGKLNSHYMHIPPFFMFMMYLYAIVQAYTPFNNQDIIPDKGFISTFNTIFLIATLIGKVFVMLSLCWIVYKKRLIFFIIHRSDAIELTHALLSELDQESVEF